jgi:flavin reductase (DIM6/NTAB) family NADH-FMN oxidoreductase RutF
MTDINPQEIPPRTMYRLMVSLVVPRPVAFTTSMSAAGLVNVAPFSYFTMAGHRPPRLVVCVHDRAGQPKDTARNAAERGEFVVHILDEAQTETANATSGDYPADVSEVELLGMALLPSQIVKVPRLALAPAAFECKLEQIIRLEGSPATSMLIGQVVWLHLRDDLAGGDRVDLEKLRPVGRLGGDDFLLAATAKVVTIPRPVLDPTSGNGVR